MAEMQQQFIRHNLLLLKAAQRSPTSPWKEESTTELFLPIAAVCAGAPKTARKINDY